MRTDGRRDQTVAEGSFPSGSAPDHPDGQALTAETWPTAGGVEVNI